MNKKIIKYISLALWLGVLINTILTNSISELRTGCIIFTIYMIGDLFSMWDTKEGE